jgi:hypothetical protein
MDILIILSLFVIKHWFIDFVWQTQEEIANKGTYGNLIGIQHSVKHGLGTYMVLFVSGFGMTFPIMYAISDLIMHYHIDWAKMNLSQNFTPKDHAFWVWFGIDQMLHYLTYILFLFIMVS